MEGGIDQKEPQQVSQNEERLLNEVLQPHIEVDNGGYKRKIYTLNGKSFAFKGREELPIYKTLQESRSVLVGELPKWVKAQDYSSYRDTVRKTQLKEGSEHFATNKTVQGVVELLLQLGNTDKELFTLSVEIGKGIYSPQALEMIDELIAANFISDDGEFSKHATVDGEALVVLSRMGNKEAQELIAKKKKILQERKIDLRQERAVPNGTEALNPKELVCVHATKYAPQALSATEYSIPTTYDATHGLIPRNTIHTSLNHKVEAHMDGSWENAGYVIISPFEQVMEKNGVPQGLNTVDTWWARNPGEPLVFPDATIIYSGGADVKGLYEKEEGNVKVKSEGITIDDYKEVVTIMEQGGRVAVSSFDYQISKAVENGIRIYESQSNGGGIDPTALQERLQQYFYQGDLEKNNTFLLNLIKGVEASKITSFQDQALYILEEAGVGNLLFESHDRFVTLDALAGILAKEIEAKIASTINTIAVNRTVQEKGFTPQPGGMWEWGDGNGKVTDQTIVLAEQLGTRAATHLASPQGFTGQQVLKSIAEAGGHTEDNGFDWKAYNPKFEQYFSQLDPRSRRVFYNSGLLTARAA